MKKEKKEMKKENRADQIGLPSGLLKADEFFKKLYLDIGHTGILKVNNNLVKIHCIDLKVKDLT